MFCKNVRKNNQLQKEIKGIDFKKSAKLKERTSNAKGKEKASSSS